MGSPELGYVHKIDKHRQNPPSREDIGDWGKEAEETVIEFFRNNFPGVEIRRATPAEDSGKRESGGKAVDAVAYIDGKPSLGLQITTSTDSAVKDSKSQLMKDFPFLRLAEMRNTDPSIPRALVFLKAGQVAEYVKNPDFKRHPEMAGQILESVIKSLQFASLKTKDQDDHKRINVLLAMFQKELEQIKKGRLN